jgi:hypothetical protein
MRIHTTRGRVLPLAMLVALVCPSAAAADSISLSVAPQPVKSITSEVSWSAYSEEGTFPAVAANNPGVPCAANPEADDGTLLTPAHLLESGWSGSYTGSVNFTPGGSGQYTLCGWLETPVGLLEMSGGPVTASTSLPVLIRPPAITLSLSLPRPAVPHRRFTIDLVASSEASREFVVEGFAATRRGCPVNYAAEEGADHLIDREALGGPWLFAGNVEGLRAGSYIFCAWADGAHDEGLYPEETAHLLVRVGAAPSRRRHHRARR